MDEDIKIIIGKKIATSENYNSSGGKLFLKSVNQTFNKNKKHKKKIESEILPLGNNCYADYILKFSKKDFIVVENFLLRIVKGLFYHNFKKTIPKKYTIKSIVYEDSKPSIFETIKVNSKKISIDDDIFFALHSGREAQPEISIWELYFYKLPIGSVVIEPLM